MDVVTTHCLKSSLCKQPASLFKHPSQKFNCVQLLLVCRGCRVFVVLIESFQSSVAAVKATPTRPLPRAVACIIVSSHLKTSAAYMLKLLVRDDSAKKSAFSRLKLCTAPFRVIQQIRVVPGSHHRKEVNVFCISSGILSLKTSY